MPQRSRRGRHRRRHRTRVPVPTAVGTLALAAAASGALSFSHSTGISLASEVAVSPLPGLPDAPAAASVRVAVREGSVDVLSADDARSVRTSGDGNAVAAAGAPSAAATTEADALAVDRVVAPVSEPSPAEQEVAAAAKVARVSTVLEQRKQAADRAARAKERKQRQQRKERTERRIEQRAERRAEALARATVLPVRRFVLTAGFGYSGRMWSHLHTGTDFAAPIGTPVMAVANGAVVEAGWAGAYGNRIIVRHTDGTQTWYCHLSAILHSGGPVNAGEVIGLVGATGNVTGPHLHLEVHPGGGGPVNPLTWLRAHGVGI